ncbi:hypothetical protein MBLNU459_g5564t1 [Dothideomycetes sp. NU459]
MLAALRRSSACLPRTLSTVTIAPSSLVTRPTATFKSSSIQRLSHPSAAASRSLHRTTALRQLIAEEGASLPTEDGPITTFAELGSRKLVHANVVRALTRQMGLETMTEVQTATINEALQGTDILAQARTGTGKTLGFLIPVLQNIIASDPSLAEQASSRRRPRTTADDIRTIIVSPTRELAEQIAVEARKLVQNTGVIVQTAVGGTQKSAALRDMQRNGCHILVGTPGRIKDIFSDPRSGVSAPGLTALVFDEADRLLDQGFWPEIQEIMSLLPPVHERDRQTLMFSATVPREVVKLVQSTLKPGFQFVKTVRDDEEPTHTRVPQTVVSVAGFENSLPAVVELCTKAIAAAQRPDTRPFKAIVYFNATAEVTLAASTINNLALAPAAADADAVAPDSFRRGRGSHPFGSTRIFEINARLSQNQRTRAADGFRNCRSGILLSTDVTARGMDFPNVTHVIQVGLPTSRDTYIHRIGRTARAGKEGEGWLIVSELERRELGYRLRDLPLKHDDTTLKTGLVNMTREAQIPADAAAILRQVAEATKLVHRDEKVAVYQAQLGIYGWMQSKRALITAMNNLSRYGWGMPQPPFISRALAQRLGISRLEGVNLGSNRSAEDGHDSMDGARGRDLERRGYQSRGDRDGGSSRGAFGGGDRERSRGGFGGDRERRGGDRDGDRRSGGFERRSHFGEGRQERSGGFGGNRGGDRDGGFGGGRERKPRY